MTIYHSFLLAERKSPHVWGIVDVCYLWCVQLKLSQLASITQQLLSSTLTLSHTHTYTDNWFSKPVFIRFPRFMDCKNKELIEEQFFFKEYISSKVTRGFRTKTTNCPLKCKMSSTLPKLLLLRYSRVNYKTAAVLCL